MDVILEETHLLFAGRWDFFACDLLEENWKTGSFLTSFHVKPCEIVIVYKFYGEFLRIMDIEEEIAMRYNIKNRKSERV